MGNWNINGTKFSKYTVFSPKLSAEEAEYDPLHRLGQKSTKVRTAGNSPVHSPSKKSCKMILIVRNTPKHHNMGTMDIYSGSKYSYSFKYQLSTKNSKTFTFL